MTQTEYFQFSLEEEEEAEQFETFLKEEGVKFECAEVKEWYTRSGREYSEYVIQFTIWVHENMDMEAVYAKYDELRP